MRSPVRLWLASTLAISALTLDARCQEPVTWKPELEFSTFSIAAVDPATGEVGVAVTTRVACVGNGVPWVRAGVGAVATQANTRTEYGNELLDWLAQGLTAPQALGRAVAADTGAARRQVGVIGLQAGAGSAQHTGERTNPWAGHRAGANYVTQGNLLVGPEVLAAVAQSFESTAASDRHLADRLIEALAAGHAKGEHVSPGIRIGYYRQDFSTLDFEATVHEALREAARQGTEQDLRSHAAGFLIDAEVLRTKIGALSEGQKGLVAFAGICLLRPGLLILDEPTNHINFRHIPVIAAALDKYEGAMILVSHVPDFVKKIRIDQTLDLAEL